MTTTIKVPPASACTPWCTLEHGEGGWDDQHEIGRPAVHIEVCVWCRVELTVTNVDGPRTVALERFSSYSSETGLLEVGEPQLSVNDPTPITVAEFERLLGIVQGLTGTAGEGRDAAQRGRVR